MSGRPVDKSRRILIVDDDRATREGRRAWLERDGFNNVDDDDFHEALAYLPEQWRGVSLLIVDGFDKASDEERAKDSDRLGLDAAMLAFDRYMGVQVVRAARKTHPDLVVVVVSSFVDDSPALVERFFQAAPDCFIYPHSDVNSPADFVRAVHSPNLDNRAGFDKRNARMLELKLDKSARVNEVLELLSDDSAGKHGLSRPLVEAVRDRLVEDVNASASEIQQRYGVSRRQLDKAVDTVRELLPSADEYSAERKGRIERLQERANSLLGREHKWYKKYNDDPGSERDPHEGEHP
jgi:CheY-like chemotaxis protein